MDLIYIIKETSLMMGFTFLVGIAFAYVLKAMTFFFSGLSEKGLSAVLKNGRVWRRAYRMDIARTYRYIRTVTRLDGGFITGDAKSDADHGMDGLAEYHLGNLEDTAKQDKEMSCLYELHHGKI